MNANFIYAILITTVMAFVSCSNAKEPKNTKTGEINYIPVPDPTTSTHSSPEASDGKTGLEEEDVLTLISDPKFKAYAKKRLTEKQMYLGTDPIEGKWDTDGNGKLSRAEAAAAKAIHLYAMNVKSLSGLEFFTGLEYLCFSKNRDVTEVDVTHNTKLQRLIFAECQISEVDITENTELVFLEINNNKLRKLDILKNTKLRALWCNDNLLRTLDASTMDMKSDRPFKLYCGRQKAEDGTKQVLALTLSHDMKELWENMLEDKGENTNVNVKYK
mgnify:CR=1 FL=1